MSKLKTVTIPRGYDGIKIEFQGATATIHRGLHDDQGRDVVHVSVDADTDRYAGDPQWWCPDLARQGLSPGGIGVRIVKMNKADLPQNWDKDALQFPRLIAEIAATCRITKKDLRRLRESMDLSAEEVDQLFDRAQRAWDRIKAELRP